LTKVLAPLRDHDAIFGNDIREQVRNLGIREVLSAPRSPWQRAYIERVIGSIGRECLDHVIVFEEASPRRTLADYFQYYHGARTHPALEKDSPQPRAYSAAGNRASGGAAASGRTTSPATNDEPPEQPKTSRALPPLQVLISMPTAINRSALGCEDRSKFGNHSRTFAKDGSFWG
jgi:hypothetical protein